jgi:hypothetical protein
MPWLSHILVRAADGTPIAMHPTGCAQENAQITLWGHGAHHIVLQCESVAAASALREGFSTAANIEYRIGERGIVSVEECGFRHILAREEAMRAKVLAYATVRSIG